MVSALLFGVLLASAKVQAASNFACTASAANTTAYEADITSLGCWTDAVDRSLAGKETSSSLNDPQSCGDYCGNLGYNYSAVEYTTMNLYSISNPNPNAVPDNAKRQPVCLTNPFCSQKACDTNLSIAERVAALVPVMTLEEKISNMVDSASGVVRLGLPPYEWWSEGLHGVASSPGVTFNFPNGSNFSYATSFPMPILMGAAFDDPLIHDVASTVGKEARAFGNYQQAGFDFWTPNINTFLDPRWGRGLEVPSEDSFHVASYVSQLIPGLQGGLENLDMKQIIATCKHFAVYDVETNRNGQNYDPTQQDLGEYYLAPFKTCVRDVHVGSVMCSYNAVDGIPSCANEYLLQYVLREDWGFTEPYRYVTSDCDAVGNIYSPHNFTDSAAAAAAVALNAGTNLDCGTTYLLLNESVANNWTTMAQVDASLTNLYTALFTVGYFDGQPEYDSLSWSDVSTPSAQSLAYQAAWEGMTLLKNDGLLPLSSSYSNVALIGPWANATTQMQGNYEGVAPYLKSPLEAAQAQWANVQYAEGTAINSTNTTGFGAAISAATASDVIIYMGGIDTSIEAEGMDRTSIVWPGNQLELIAQLSELGKPLLVVQFGAGQLDDSSLLSNGKVSALMWAGYPGQDGGYAVVDVLVGKKSAAGRLTTTQYPANYTNEVSIFNPNLRPNASFPGRTYKWYDGKPVIPFGYGLHYTTFDYAWNTAPKDSYDISSLVAAPSSYYGSNSTPINDATRFTTVAATIRNTGKRTSDYVGLVFLSTKNAGPKPYPEKWLVSYARAHDIPSHGAQELFFALTLGSLSRADAEGDLVIYPGTYELTLDIDAELKFEFELRGQSAVIDPLPRQASSYSFTVPVHPQA